LSCLLLHTTRPPPNSTLFPYTTLFRSSKNKIYAYTDEISENMGEATNLNKTSFSANAGLKFDLKLTDQIQFNVEPNFKYLMNPVNNIEKFNPYTVGVNAGVTVSFK